MINWLWLIPAFISGGVFGFGICCIFAVNAGNNYDYHN